MRTIGEKVSPPTLFLGISSPGPVGGARGARLAGRSRAAPGVEAAGVDQCREVPDRDFPAEIPSRGASTRVSARATVATENHREGTGHRLFVLLREGQRRREGPSNRGMAAPRGAAAYDNAGTSLPASGADGAGSPNAREMAMPPRNTGPPPTNRPSGVQRKGPIHGPGNSDTIRPNAMPVPSLALGDDRGAVTMTLV